MSGTYNSQPQAPMQAPQYPQAMPRRDDYSLEYDLPVGFRETPGGPLPGQQYMQNTAPPAPQPNLYRPEVRPSAPVPLSQPPQVMYQPQPQTQQVTIAPQSYGAANQPSPVIRTQQPYAATPAFNGYSPQPQSQAGPPQQFSNPPRPVQLPPGNSGQSVLALNPQSAPPRTGNSFAPLK